MGRPRLTVVPTGLGARFLLLYGLLCGVYFVTAYANLFFLLMCFLGALFVVATAATARNLMRVEASLGTAAPVPVGEPVRVPVSIDACRAGGAWAVQLELTIRGRCVRSEVAPRLMAGATWECAVHGLPRGVHAIAQASLVSTAPLSLFRGRRTLELEPRPIVVHPAPLVGGDPADGPGGAAGPLAGVTADRAQPAAVREYRAGDELRRIHWRASARGAGLQVREWDEGSDRGVEVVLDLRCADGEPARERFERALSRVTALGLRAFADKRVLTVGTQTERREFGEGFASRDQFLRWTAGLEPLPASAGSPPSASPQALVIQGA